MKKPRLTDAQRATLADTPAPKICSICGESYTGWGNNAWPVNNGRCCNDCNSGLVIPERLIDLYSRARPKETS